MHSDVEQFTSLALIFAIHSIMYVAARASKQSVEAKLYFMEMDVESKPTLVAFLQCDSYAGVCAGTNTTPACLSKTIRPRLVP